MQRTEQKSILLQTKLFCLVLLGCVTSFFSHSQTIGTYSKKITTAEFLFPEVEYEEMAVISNVLKVKNNSDKNCVFTLHLSFPSGWKTINDSKKEYTLIPNDSVFIPVRLLTNNKAAKGGIKYNIMAFISTNEGRQMAVSNFLAGHPKVSNWQMYILPKPRIYFLNQEDTAPFKISLSNYGDEKEDIILSMSKIGTDFTVTDTTGRLFKKNYIEFSLQPFSDTIIPFSVQILKPQRNFKRIDNYSYLPNLIEQEKHYALFLKANELGINAGVKNNKSRKVDFIKLANSIDFIKLNNTTTANAYGASVIPLTMIANINNILGQQPIMNAVFYGNTILDKKSRLDYSLQTSFSYYKYTSQTAKNMNGIISYYHQKGFVSLGSGVGLNFGNLKGLTNGKGISAGYKFNKRQIIGFYALRNGLSFANYKSTSIGSAYSYTLEKIRFGLGYDHTDYKSNNFSNGLNGNVYFRINRHQTGGITGQYSIFNYNNVLSNRKFLSAFYSIVYLKGKANSAINYTYREGVGNFGAGLLVNNNFTANNNASLNLANSYRLKSGMEIRLTDYYNSFMIPGSNQKNIIFNNLLTFALPPQKGKASYVPAIYLNYSDYFSEQLLSSGLQLSINSYDLNRNFRLGYFVKAGYNKILNYPELGKFFTLQTNTFASYRTFNFIVRYSYGPQGITNLVAPLRQQSVYSQTFSGSISNQYQFKNKHFVLENSLNYNYLNLNKRHSMGLFTQLFYFTNTGWRFNINASYNYNISQKFAYSYSPGAPNNYSIESTDRKTKGKSFQLGVGAKKDFGIPIPKRFTKARFCNANFKVFLDINGNKKFDISEVLLENVVIRMNDFEVLTNDIGEASFINMGLGSYKLQVIPLVEIGAWFPIVSDSIDVCGPDVIYIPFSKGVEILGNVQVDREKFSSGFTEQLDISRIKIFLVDSLGKTTTSVTDIKGNFLFYVPYGKYTLKFDEKILGNNFELTQNDIPLELTDGMYSYYHTFFIIEKKRIVKTKKFDANGKLIGSTETKAGSSTTTTANNNTNKSTKDNKKDNKIPNPATTNPNTIANTNKIKGDNSKDSIATNEKQLEDLIKLLRGKNRPKFDAALTRENLAQIENLKIEKRDFSKEKDSVVYTIQIGAYKNGLPESVLATILKQDIKIESYTDPKDGLTKYFMGSFHSLDEAAKIKDKMIQQGLTDPFVVVINKGKVISVKEFNDQKTK
jgi:hypothetical protein